MEHMFGELLEFSSNEEVNHFIENMDKNDAVRLIETALSYCQKNGIFTLDESYIVYKSLQKLKENNVA